MPHQLALTAEALFTYAWNGFVTIPLSDRIGDRIDVAGQIAIDILAVALVIVVALSLARNGVPTRPVVHRREHEVAPMSPPRSRRGRTSR